MISIGQTYTGDSTFGQITIYAPNEPTRICHDPIRPTCDSVVSKTALMMGWTKFLFDGSCQVEYFDGDDAEAYRVTLFASRLLVSRLAVSFSGISRRLSHGGAIPKHEGVLVGLRC